jgi:hypothetical protein
VPSPKPSVEVLEPVFELRGAILRVRAPTVRLSEGAYQEMLRRLHELLHQKGLPVGLLIDLRGSPPLNALERKLAAQSAERAEAAHPGLVMGVALVSDSAWANGAMTAITWLLKFPVALRAFDSEPAARAWLLPLVHGRSSAASSRE